MKKIAVFLLSVALVALAGCAPANTVTVLSEAPTSSVATPAPTEAPTPTPAPTATPVPQNVNLLTGEPTLSADAVGKRPVAVMVNNADANLPQYGISDADLIFEVPVEGDITRLMCMFGDYTKVPDMCSIRSCRYYYPMLSESFDAIYVHWGADPSIATDKLNALDLDNVDGTYSTYDLFGRDNDRMDQGYAIEHCSVFYGSQLKDALANYDHRMDLKEEKKTANFLFSSEEKAATGGAATALGIQFGGGYFSDFTYDAQTKTYLKDHNGSAHMDGVTGLQLAFDNLVVLETPIGLVPGDSAGLRTIDVLSEGKKGYYYAGGKVQPIIWKKASDRANLALFDANGEALVLNTGKTYIAVCDPDSVTINA